MYGSLENRKWFKFQHVFDINEDGVEIDNHLYRWGEIQSLRHLGQSGGAGYGILFFKDGNKCVLNLRTFRQKGASVQVSVSGKNKTFAKLKEFPLRNI